MTDAEERTFLIQAIRLLRTVGFEDHQLFKVVKYAKEVFTSSLESLSYI